MAESQNSTNSENSETSGRAADYDLPSAADHNDQNGIIAPELAIQLIIDPHLAHRVHPELHLHHPDVLIQHPDLHLQYPGLLFPPPDFVLDAVIDNDGGSAAHEDSGSTSITTDAHDDDFDEEFPLEPPILETVRRSRRLERHRGEFMYYEEVTRRGRTFTYPVYQPSDARQQGFDVSVEFPECLNDSDSDYSH